MEALPQVVTKSIGCGTLVASFNIGGLKDIIIKDKTGILVEPFNIEEYCSAIDSILRIGKKL
jgi:glycosyltransferase involved in cell wall biosynthesis